MLNNIFKKRKTYSLASHHPFIDGNKRTGIYIMLTFLEVNAIYISFKDEELVELGIKIADGSFKYDDVVSFLKSKIKE